MTAGTVQPCDSYTISYFEMCDSRTKCGYDTGAFVARNKRWCRLDGPVALCGVQIGMAYASGDNFYKGLPGPGCWYGDFLHDKGLAELLNHCCLHGFGDGHDSSSYWTGLLYVVPVGCAVIWITATGGGDHEGID